MYCIWLWTSFEAQLSWNNVLVQCIGRLLTQAWAFPLRGSCSSICILKPENMKSVLETSDGWPSICLSILSLKGFKERVVCFFETFRNHIIFVIYLEEEIGILSALWPVFPVTILSVSNTYQSSETKCSGKNISFSAAGSFAPSDLALIEKGSAGERLSASSRELVLQSSETACTGH